MSRSPFLPESGNEYGWKPGAGSWIAFRQPYIGDGQKDSLFYPQGRRLPVSRVAGEYDPFERLPLPQTEWAAGNMVREVCPGPLLPAAARGFDGIPGIRG
jgi:hypothetical protein